MVKSLLFVAGCVIPQSMENFNRKPILAFDCATDCASIALQIGAECHVRTLPRGQHAAMLVPAIQALLAHAGRKTNDLAAIVTPLGPGSFTGLRIALATAHGLHLASGVPLKCPTTLQTLAFRYFRQYPQVPHITALLNAGKGEAAWQVFNNVRPLPTIQGEATLTPITELHAILKGAYAIGNIEMADVSYVAGIDAADLCAMAEFLPITDAAQALPIYVRPADAKIPSPPAWLAS